ncbi:LysR family transcriptional regulator [Rhodobacter xanthinilyticus]|uniref:LysR family transcriptional regulator n=1 Tax=Rhodobacter xanthinilyticus TaxID=1850250 RepID=A0A1D9MF76_9RHOB|nr:LysR family transcriptional regulator [Rhodobacter xanthinilyticus]AOZ70531.1 LysR family transcriptional regulator [Rhodobacter xanthinilyticus]
MQTTFDWNDLKFFLALARLKRMTVAGRALGIDQTTVARRIRALEKAVGAQLFIRDEAGYALTQAGERLLPIAMEVERSSTRVHEQIVGEAGRLAGMVRIGAPDGLGTYVVTPLLARFQRDNPDVDVALVVRSRQFQMSHQEVHLSLDLALPTSGRLLARRMTDYHLHFFAAPDYLRRYGRPERLRDLRHHRLVGYIPEMLFSDELRYLEELGITTPVGFASTSMIAQREAVREGAGLAILPRFMALDDPDLEPVLVEDCVLTRTVWILSHQSTEDLARVRVVSEYLQQVARKERHRFLIS